MASPAAVLCSPHTLPVTLEGWRAGASPAGAEGAPLGTHGLRLSAGRCPVCARGLGLG